MGNIKRFYERIRENRFKRFILKLSLIIPVVGVSIKILDFIINDLIYKTPRPILNETADFNILYYIFHEGYWKIGIGGIVFLIILDIVTIKFFNKSSNVNVGKKR